MKVLNFSSNIDLQTSLQLVPFNDEECVGAKVLDMDINNANTCGGIHNARIIRISTLATHEVDNEDWREKDFGSILTAVRELNGPLVVFVEEEENGSDTNSDTCTSTVTAAQPISSDSSNPDNDSQQEGSSSNVSAPIAGVEDQGESMPPSAAPPAENIALENIASKVIKRGLLNWGSSISKHAASITSAAVEAAATVSSNSNTVTAKLTSFTAVEEDATTATTTNEEEEDPCTRLCDIYIQENGKFVPIQKVSGKNNSNSNKTVFSPGRSNNSSNTLNNCLVTNSSFLQVRISEEKPCPSSYKFQWYRSCYSSSGSADWLPILGANVAGYQPSAIDVGKWIKCCIVFSSDSSSLELVEYLALPDKISASVDLFNAARKNFYNGSIFNNLVGRGKASGREFRIKIKVGQSPNNNTTCSHLWIYQVSGGTAESLVADEVPIQGATAIADALHPKHLDLIFPTLPQEAGMVQALLSDKITLSLMAPNRVSRESFLLALGIANFTGKPSELTPSSLLFPDNNHINNSAEKDTRIICSPPRSVTRLVDPGGIISEGATSSAQNIEATNPFLSPSSNDGTNKKMQNMESEIFKLNSILTAKRDFSISLQAQLQLMEEELRKKDQEIERIQQDFVVLNKKHQETCDSLTLTQNQVQKHDAILAATKQEYTERITLLNEKTSEYKERYEEYEQMVLLLEKDKLELSAAVEVRDTKLLRMEELQEATTVLRKQVEVKKDLEEELQNVRASNRDLNDRIAETEQLNQRLQKELEKEQAASMEARLKIEDHQSSISLLESRVSVMEGLNHNLCMERNSYRQKADSLSKEMSKICRFGLDVKQIERLMAESKEMETRIRELENERRYERAEMERLRVNYDELLESQVYSRQELSASRHSGPTLPAVAESSIEHKSDLERVISNLTEYLNAKEYQLETMTQVNRSLMEEVQSLTEKLRHVGK